MHSMFFVAAAPIGGARYASIPQDWQAFVGYVANKLQQLSGVERLGENVWLVNMRIDPLPLGLLVAGAHEHGIAFRLLPFADEPQWLPVDSGPTSTPARNE
jgi:hypothetical protein